MLSNRFTVYAPDLPGCGDGPCVPDDIAEDDYLAMVCEAVAEIADGAPVDGERDNLAWPSIQARVDACRAHKPDIRVEIVPDAGHWVQYEEAQAVNRLLNDFFD